MSTTQENRVAPNHPALQKERIIPKVLIVDDNPANLFSMEKVLTKLEADVVKAQSGKEALSLMLREDFAVVLMDVRMPDMDGFETASLMRGNDETRYIPIIFVTGNNQDDNYVFQGYEAGAVDYLFKPINPDILKSKVRVFLELFQQRKALDVMEQLKQEMAERQRAEKQLQEAYLELQQAHRQLEQSQTTLIQTEKMSALGTLVAGVAHELNNPMMGIMHFSQYCLKRTDKEDSRYAVLEDIDRETRRCTEIVRNLLTFSHAEVRGDEAFQEEDFAEILDRVLRLLSFRIEKQEISVTHHIADGTPKIPMRSGDIQQLILNLLNNAFDALKTSMKKEVNVDIRPEGERLRLVIADTGCGIPAKTLKSIFDPFFTTKPVGQGTGLGLSVSMGIVQVHKGELLCESQEGTGTTFTILLPRVQNERNPKDDETHSSD